MNHLIIILLITTQFSGYSQNISDTLLRPFHPIETTQYEISLVNSIDTSKCGFWVNGDYRIFVEMQPLVEKLQNEYVSLLHYIQNEIKHDSITLISYKESAQRYLNAINQFRYIQGGFDLRNLVIYAGIDKAELNNGNSDDVELYVRKLAESGNVAIFYKGQRIYKLNCIIIKDYVMSTITIYYEDEKNYVFSYFGHINW